MWLHSGGASIQLQAVWRRRRGGGTFKNGVRHDSDTRPVGGQGGRAELCERAALGGREEGLGSVAGWGSS